MRICSLSSIISQLRLGEPLNFNVFDSQRQPLLARGQLIKDTAQLEELLRRGALVEVDELTEAVVQQQPPPRVLSLSQRLARLPQDWERSCRDVQLALNAEPARLAEALHASTDQMLGLIDLAPDVALSQVVRQQEGGAGHYGVDHSIHAATACLATARYLGWSPMEQRRAFQAALSMNLGMLELQARLATQVSPPTTRQREVIREHPERSVALLSEAGIDDPDWLEAVLQHHEQPDGSGYPSGCSSVGKLAELLRFADIYTARLSHRAHRPAMSAHQAGREILQMAEASPLAAALIKAFGIFPPGCMVKLASGELGMVVRNGAKAYHPLVATLTNSRGESRQSPLLRDSARGEHAVVALLSAQSMPMRLTDERVVSLISAEA